METITYSNHDYFEADFNGHNELDVLWEEARKAFRRQGGVTLRMEPNDGTRYDITLVPHLDKVLVGCMGRFGKLVNCDFSIAPKFYLEEGDLASDIIDTGNLYTDCVLCDVINRVYSTRDVATFYDWQKACPDMSVVDRVHENRSIAESIKSE